MKPRTNVIPRLQVQREHVRVSASIFVAMFGCVIVELHNLTIQLIGTASISTALQSFPVLSLSGSMTT
jgi:hypothetical protein